eukprot:scaffold345_cov134-Cylindrotheca_fusiformis.AAC.71
MAAFIEAIDNGSITDVLQQWGDEADDEDLDLVAFSTSIVDDFMGPTLIPESPRRISSVGSSTTDSRLESLMNRYPKFIPADLTMRKRRTRPVCLFVNFMGTRRKESKSNVPVAKLSRELLSDEKGSYSASAFPSDIPMAWFPPAARPQKRQRLSTKADPNGQPESSKVSPKPSLCPQAKQRLGICISK